MFGRLDCSQVKKILSDGLNERFSGGLFGHGSYLAEDSQTGFRGSGGPLPVPLLSDKGSCTIETRVTLW